MKKTFMTVKDLENMTKEDRTNFITTTIVSFVGKLISVLLKWGYSIAVIVLMVKILEKLG